MSLLNDKVRAQVSEALGAVASPVTLVFFTQDSDALECEMCKDMRTLLEEVAALSPQLRLEIHDFKTDVEAVEHYGIDKIPALAIVGERDVGVRYYGIPSGYEFGSLVEDIKQIASGSSGLSEPVREAVAKIDRPVRLQVFVTPTCPYCPRAVLLAHQLAMESEHVTADMVEATEFPHLASKFNVHGVPRTVINDTHYVEGAVPERALLDEIARALA